jgi:single-strand DNA-binding protein
MSMNYNKVILIGNITKDLELRHTTSGIAVTSFTIAINTKWKEKEETTFVDIVVFNTTAENCCKYLKKGNPIFVEGRLQQKKWETEDGQKRSKMEVIGERVQFLSFNKNVQGSGVQNTSQKEVDGEQFADVPF